MVEKGKLVSYNTGAFDADFDSIYVTMGRSMQSTPFGSELNYGNTVPKPSTNNSTEWHESMSIPGVVLPLPNTPEQHPVYYVPNGTPFTTNNPFGMTPSTTFLNSQNGQFNFTFPNTITYPTDVHYIGTQRVASYVNGDMNAAVWRDYAMVLKPFSNNRLPTLNGAFGGANTAYKFFINNVQQFVPTTVAGRQVAYAFAGDSIDIEVNFRDTVTSFSGGFANKMSMYSTSLAYSSLTNFGIEKSLGSTLPLGPTTPCTAPPCVATSTLINCALFFDNQPNATPCATYKYTTNNPVINTPASAGGYLDGQLLTSWRTSCNHVKNLRKAGFGGTSSANYNLFNFNYRAVDNNCPLPGMSSKVLGIKLYPAYIIPAPILQKATLSTLLTSATLNWTAVTDSSNAFLQYYIYQADSTGTFVLIDSIQNITTSSYIVNNLDPANTYSFYIATQSFISNCNTKPILKSNIESANVFVGIKDVKSKLFNLTLYPNPTDKVSLLTFNLNDVETVKIELYNVNNQKIRTVLNEKRGAGLHTIEISKDKLASGTYYLKVNIDSKEIVKKIVFN